MTKQKKVVDKRGEEQEMTTADAANALSPHPLDHPENRRHEEMFNDSLIVDNNNS